MHNVIGLVGRARHGKDTCGSLLKDYKAISFAMPLKTLAKRMFDLSDEQLYGNDRDKLDARGLSLEYWNEVEDRYTDCFCLLGDLFPKHPQSVVIKKMDEVLDSIVTDNRQFSARLVLQRLGTEFGRAVWPDVWTNALKELAKKYPKVVITDCRFMNEALLIKNDLGGELWWVDASKRVPIVNNHASEPNYEDFKDVVDRVIDNNGTLNDLEALFCA